ncbi:VOC family protein [Evansella cellulosilytica]|uniref:Glyoxalase/bleomycin resistance protein/dioxygenase n=1 Tax=Evansella cellulosilytica (strain ATCC 21833 / DSM 2522 / FERM P-1141 / JCM 9156 / N-4) TaxID=649639 RepID=E6TWG8_EVAC2|nr:VOC family protein [Evansella cellulosilytica]ADU32231.1 Glyoxalase/bleomycin resistance protein/dioxygenase [Evansella cellulosilytica DSM 2522]
MFERLDTICLTVSNIEDASNWYEALGFKVDFQGEGYRILAIGNSHVPLTLEEGTITSKANRAFPILFARDINKTYKMLQGKGIKVTEIKDDGDNTFFDFYDLDNNKIQVCYWE